MTLNQFLQDFCFRVTTQNQGDIKLIILSEVIRKTDGELVKSIRETIDIYTASNWIRDSQTAISLSKWTWDDLIEDIKRRHLDMFALQFPIENWYPQDKIANPNISNVYCP